jgi:hypothetical protein
MGVTGQNKGIAIIKKYLREPGGSPDEVHFYDDLEKNTKEVEDALASKVPSELHIYGPGEFAHDEVSPEFPKKSYEGSDEDLDPRGISESRRLEDDMVMERWSYLAGIKR